MAELVRVAHNARRIEPAEPCQSGVHACRVEDLPFWLAPLLYEIELDGDVMKAGRKLVASRARLLGRVDRWDEERRDQYVRTCAERAHQLARSVAPRLDQWEAIVEPAMPQGPALLGFVAAAIAEQVSGREGYAAERGRQAEWLVDNLDLRA